MNASSAEVRKSAVAALERDYKSSAQAINLVLQTLSQERIGSLSPSGVINSLYYLGATDAAAWDRQMRQNAQEAITRVQQHGAGTQTEAAIGSLKSLLQKIP